MRYSILILFLVFSSACISEGKDFSYDYPDSDSYQVTEDSEKTKNDRSNDINGNDEMSDVTDEVDDYCCDSDAAMVDDDSIIDDETVLDSSNDADYIDNENDDAADDEAVLPDSDTADLPKCGNNVVDGDEVCEKDEIKPCLEVDPIFYESGNATCKDDCSGWITTACSEYSNCEDKPDYPDPDFLDTNCDGIDGDIEDSVFVDMFSGSNLNTGTIDSPVRSISKGIYIASDSGKTNVLVSTGTYEENVTLISGISIHGGYTGDPDWTRTSSSLSVTRLVRKGFSVNGASGIVLSQMEIVAPDASESGESSIGMIISDCSDITLRNVTIISGDGTSGADGADGEDGDKGGDGEQGNPGCEGSTATFCDGCSQPSGGSGGVSSCGANGGSGGVPGISKSDGSPGENGVGSTSNGGSGGNLPVMGEENCYMSSGLDIHGKSGAHGKKGEDGSGGAAVGVFNAGEYINSNGEDGEDGANGQGGGGGGGGMGGKSWCDSYGSSGGGGGAGGCGAKAGKGGIGGGASFALVVINSTGIVLDDVELETGNGGSGGDGGTGGVGGLYGFGQAGGNYGGGGDQDDGGCGGHGGHGGLGGSGGHGGGGGGGGSICIIKDSVSSIAGEDDISCSYGTAGEGGGSTGYNGKDGINTDIYAY